MGDCPGWEQDFGQAREPERTRDQAIDRARNAILELVSSQDRQIFYGRQLKIILEKRFYRWITDFASGELAEEGEIGSERVQLEKGSQVWVKFVFARTHRFRKRQMKRALNVIRDFSRPDIARGCGSYAELQFKLSFLKRGFVLKGEDVREYSGKQWTSTGHNMDFVVERDGQAYAAEVKNRLDHIEREELRIKLELCRYLGLKPLFIMRAAAKSYNHMVIEQGGYALIFQTQIYPPGQEALVERMRGVLGLPAVCSKGIPDSIMDRFVRWHEKGAGAR
jgi:hypothetical protein